MEFGTYSYSKLTTYKQCQLKAYLAFDQKVEQKKLPPEKAAASLRGTIVHKTAEDYLADTGPLHGEISSKWGERLAYAVGNSETELGIGFTETGKCCGFFDKDVFFRLRYDALVMLDAPEKIGLLEFKTGKPRPEHLSQLSCYARSLFLVDADTEQVNGRIIYLDYPNYKHEERRYVRGCETKVVSRFMEPIWKQVEIIRKDDIATPCQSPLCGWCGYSDRYNGPCKF